VASTLGGQRYCKAFGRAFAELRTGASCRAFAGLW